MTRVGSWENINSSIDKQHNYSTMEEQDNNTPEETKSSTMIITANGGPVIEQTKPKVSVKWYKRQDLLVWLSGMVFIIVLIGLIWGVGNAREWDADSGWTHNESATSADRFLPEPFIPEEGVRGRYGNDATARWYYWKVKTGETTFWTHFFPWICYVGHQLLIWGTILYAQTNKAHEALGLGRYRTEMHMFNWLAFGLNILFHLLHFLNTHTTYDGTAQDVSMSTSQGSVIMLLVLVVLLEYRERGLFFGWPVMSSTHPASKALRLNYAPINLIRRYHGYAFAWGAIYTFWYHPMENTWGHVMGFFYTWIIMLQGSLMYTNLHLNKYWRVFQEMFVVIHGGVVAYQTGGPDLNGTVLWPMFVFGFGLCFVLTQIFGLPFWQRIPKWTRIFPVLIYAAITVGSYSQIPDRNGKYYTRITEIVRIPATYYLDFIMGWAVLYGFLFIEKKCKPVGASIVTSACKQTMYILGAVLVYASFIGAAIAVEYGDWKASLIVMMIFHTIVYTVGAMVSFMFLKQVIPQRILPVGHVNKAAEANGVKGANGGAVNEGVTDEHQEEVQEDHCTDM